MPITTDLERASEQIVVGELRDADDVVEGDAADGDLGDGVVRREATEELRVEELAAFLGEWSITAWTASDVYIRPTLWLGYWCGLRATNMRVGHR